MASAEDDERTEESGAEDERTDGSGAEEDRRTEESGAEASGGQGPQAGGEPDRQPEGDGDREGHEEIKKLEEADEVPSDPSEWPGGKAKYITFGGGEGQSDEPFGEGVTSKLGPSDVHHQPDGSVIVKGEKVDDPEQYKGEPIPGGPTDPNAPKLAGERDVSDDSGQGPSGEEESSDGGESSDGADSSESRGSAQEGQDERSERELQGS